MKDGYVDIYRDRRLLHSYSYLSGLKEYSRHTKLKKIVCYTASNLYDPGLLQVEWEDGAYALVRFKEGWTVPDFVARWNKAKQEAEIKHLICKDVNAVERELTGS